MSNQMTAAQRKTWKREVALTMLAFNLVAHVWGVWKPEAAEMARFMTTPIFLFATAAYGLDAYAKQVRS